MIAKDCTTVIDFEKKTLSLYGDRFQFRSSDTIVDTEFLDSTASDGKIKIDGDELSMKLILSSNSDGDYYTRDEVSGFGIRKAFDVFEVEEITTTKWQLKWPFRTKVTEECCWIPDGNYALDKRKRVEMYLPQKDFAIIDYREKIEDK